MLFRVLLAALLLALPALRAAGPAPLPRAHAHNDYEHPRPLLDALAQGFTSIEADLFLVDGRLLVAHDRWRVRPERTLEALYLDPLRERVRAHGGRVFPGGPTLTLLVDLKADGAATYARLREVLAAYRPMLTVFGRDGVTTNAVTVILSGDRPRALLEAEPERLAALDGRPEDFEMNPPVSLVPLVSDAWRNHFTWRGDGAMPAAELAKLKDLAARARAQGRRLRFWAAPDTPAGWAVQWDAGVDLINTDRLADLRAWMAGR
jgi:hypothetical protein